MVLTWAAPRSQVHLTSVEHASQGPWQCLPFLVLEVTGLLEILQLSNLALVGVLTGASSLAWSGHAASYGVRTSFPRHLFQSEVLSLSPVKRLVRKLLATGGGAKVLVFCCLPASLLCSV